MNQQAQHVVPQLRGGPGTTGNVPFYNYRTQNPGPQRFLSLLMVFINVETVSHRTVFKAWHTVQRRLHDAHTDIATRQQYSTEFSNRIASAIVYSIHERR